MKAKKLLTTVALASALVAPAIMATVSNTAAPTQTVHAASAINDMIAKNGYQPAKISTQKSTFTVKQGYRNGVGKPEGVVIHDTANDASTIWNEITYMQREWNNIGAYVHAFVDANNIVNIAPTDYITWGAGGFANSRYIHIELAHSHSTADFAKSVNNDAYYTAYLLKQYGLPLTRAKSNGTGTLWSHADVSNYLGGTDHSDPVGYFANYGYDMNQFYDLVSKYYTNMGGSVTPPSTDFDTVVSSSDVNKQATVNGNNVNGVYYLTSRGFESFGMSSMYNGQTFTVTKLAKTKKGLEMALLTRNGSPVAWIQSNRLTYSTVNSDPVVSRSAINETVTLNMGAAVSYLLNSGFSQFTTASGEQATAVEKATTQSGTVYYLINKNGSNWGWIKAADTTSDDNSNDPVQQPASLKVKVNNGASLYYLLSSGFSQYGTNSDTSEVRVIKKATTSNATYYLLSRDGKNGFAWVKANDTQMTSGADIETVNLVGTINYVPGYGVLMMDAPAGNYITGRYLQHGTKWKVLQRATMANGDIYYNLGGNQWMPAQYLKF
ncbi:N-acetylmuramoyl-L-alanine amidase [Lacticaseibacillus saniviri]